MKRQVILEFEVEPELEDSCFEYRGAIGTTQIAHEMIVCAVIQHQMDVIIQANEAIKTKEPGWEQYSKYLMRFHNAQKTLKVVGFIDNNLVFLEDDRLIYSSIGRIQK